MDASAAKYLEENVSGVLAKALAEMTAQRPCDGVAFLSQWLKTYAEQEEAKVIREREDKALQRERAKTQAKVAEIEKKRQTRAEERKELEDLYQGLLSNLCSSDSNWEDSMWDRLVLVSKSVTGATAAYLGIVDDEGEEPCIRYERACKNSQWLLDEVLPKDKGVTWGALLESPDDEAFKAASLWKPPSVRAVPSEPGDDSEPVKDSQSYYPVSIPCVTDVKSVHYFKMTRLGAFLALPLVYTTYYTSDGLADGKAFGEEKKAEAMRRADLITAAEAAGEEPPELPSLEEKQLVLRGKAVKMVLCLDTLGANTSFEEQQIMQAVELCKAAGQRKSQTETKEVVSQAIVVSDQALKEQLVEEVAAARAHADESTRQALEKEEAAAADGAKDMVLKKYGFLRAARVTKAAKGMILNLTHWVVVPAEMSSVVAAAALLCGYQPAQVLSKRKTVLKWEKLKLVLDEALLSALQQLQLAGPKKGLIPEHKLSFIKKLASPDGLDDDKALAISQGFQVLFATVQAACHYRSADLEVRKADYNAKKEEAGDGFVGPCLADTCDDHVE